MTIEIHYNPDDFVHVAWVRHGAYFGMSAHGDTQAGALRALADAIDAPILVKEDGE